VYWAIRVLRATDEARIAIFACPAPTVEAHRDPSAEKVTAANL
jgi:hypothetical protein